MKTIDYVPKACTTYADDEGKTVTATFLGSITLKVPTIFERADLKVAYLNAITANGTRELNELNSVKDLPPVKQLEFMRDLLKGVELSLPYYQSVQLTKLSDGAKYESFDDLSGDPECENMIQEVAAAVCNGTLLAKN